MRRQCKHCPWKKSTNPFDIPNGYSPVDHAALKSTIAEPGQYSTGPLRIMACHETHDLPCVGWLHNQIGEGNNIPLRIAAMDGRFGKYKTVGPQHEHFEDTLSEQL